MVRRDAPAVGRRVVEYGSLVLVPLLLIYVCKRYGKGEGRERVGPGVILCAAVAAPYWRRDWQDFALGRLAENLSEWRALTRWRPSLFSV